MVRKYHYGRDRNGRRKALRQGSFEIVLGDIAVDSTEPLYIQLFNSRGVALSEPFQFITKAKCNRNLVVINFVRK